jgi:hypothetical protein
MVLRACWLAVLVTACVSAQAGEPVREQLAAPELVGQLPKVIDESSGIIKSRRYPDKNVFWTHNDSGDSARIFAVDGTGKLLREVAIPKAKNVDWEEITMDEQGRLIICDTGDNFRKRKTIELYRIKEPDALDANEKVADAETFRFRYPKGEGPFDAEAVLVRGENAYLFTKETDRTRCYRLPLPEIPPADGKPVEAVRVAESNTFSVATGAAITSDGRHVALLNYIVIVVVDLPAPFEKLPDGPAQLLTSPRRLRYAFLGQTEAIAWDGDDLVLTTEGGAVYRVAKAK